MYHSTRGNKKVSSLEAILNGLAEDGGLYVIDSIPKLDYHTILEDDYPTLATKILHLFFNEFSFEELKDEIQQTYQAFDISSVVHLKKTRSAHFLELFHGPTLAFKDVALVVLPRLLKLSKEKLGYEKNITILTATSGDTGGAALNGFKDIPGVSIVVLYPNQGVSSIQEAQMCSFRSTNAKVFAINGNFDDCQGLVKKIFQENKNLEISSANSINIGRLVPQIVYYFYSYAELLKNNEIQDGEKINFVVPTGNFGDIFAGFYAKAMGLPIENLICASNKNNVLTDYFKTGKYNKKRELYKTNSPSMDIIISSNLERLLYYATNEDSQKTKEFMEKLNLKGEYEFSNPFSYFKAYCCDEEQTIQMIKKVYQESKYLIDPHTAVAYYAYEEYKKENKDSLKTVVLSTASPYKFSAVILEAFHIEYTDDIDAVNKVSEVFNLPIPKVLNYPKAQREVLNLEEAEKYVVGVIKCFM